MKLEAEAGVMEPQSNREARKGFLSRAYRGIVTCQQLGYRLLVSRPVRENFFGFKPLLLLLSG